MKTNTIEELTKEYEALKEKDVPAEPIIERINNYVYDLARECVEHEIKKNEAYLFIEIKGLSSEFEEWRNKGQ